MILDGQRTGMVHGLVVFALLVGVGTAFGQASEAQKTFEALFDAEIKKVSATRDTEDDLALAKILLEAMEDEDGPVALRLILGRHVVALAGKNPEGQVSVETALGFLEKLSKADYLQSLKGWVAVQQRQYARTAASRRVEVGEALIQSQIKLARALELAGQMDQAIAAYQKASSVASSIRSGAKESIRSMLAVASKKRSIHRRIAQLKARLKATPKDSAAALDLVKLYVVDLDDPASAQKFTFLLKDETWRENIKGAAGPIETLDSALSLRLGDWYRALAKPASDQHVQRTLLNRASLYYQHFLNDEGAAKGLSKLKAELSLKQTTEALAKLGPAAAGSGAAGRWVDLVALATLPSGGYRREGRGLVGAGARSSPLQFPVRPEGSYEVRWRFKMIKASSPTSCMILHLPVADTSVHFYIFNAAKTFGKGQGRLASFTFVQDQKALDDENPTGVPGALDKTKTHDVLVRVRVSGKQAELTLVMWGKIVSKWSGPVSQIAPRYDSKTVVPQLSAISSTIAVQAMQLRMLDGKLVRIKSE